MRNNYSQGNLALVEALHALSWISQDCRKKHALFVWKSHHSSSSCRESLWSLNVMPVPLKGFVESNVDLDDTNEAVLDLVEFSP